MRGRFHAVELVRFGPWRKDCCPRPLDGEARHSLAIKHKLFMPGPLRFATLAIVKSNATESLRPVLYPRPRAVWTLGPVSLFMDISSEMIHGLLHLAARPPKS
jgi:hypothetical protein